MCRLVCLIIGAAAGAGAWYFLQELVPFLPLLVISFFTFFATAWFLYEGFCGEEVSTTAKTVAAAGTAAGAAAKMGSTDRDYWTSEELEGAAPVSTPANFVSSSATSSSAPAPAAKPAAKKSAAKSASTKSKSSSAKSTASKSKSSKAAAKKPAAKAGPERLKKPKGKADDLKLISGVGPKLEKTLNGLGFWHFEQIAKWKKADVAIVDDELSFKGRIDRDDWIKQAKALAKGGEAEYIKVFGKKPR